MIVLDAGRLDAALNRFAAIVGEEHVWRGDDAAHAYKDAMAPREPLSYAPRGAVAPASVEEVQAVVRVAGELGVPLWPVSRGKNFGYGGAAPRTGEVVMLDLIRMNRILEVNVDMGYVVVEPGVGFDDLYHYLVDNDIPLWMSAPAHTWGSVMGNALERGVGYTPYGEHASKVCGLEIITGTGELLRTGMGALEGSQTWQAFPYGFGPSWDAAFMQSNFGIATKMGLWLMPEPEHTINLAMSMERIEDLLPAVDALRPLKLDGTVQANPSFGNIIRSLAVRGPRSTFYSGTGAMPPEALERARQQAGTGHWNFSVRLFGDKQVNLINAEKVKAAFAAAVPYEFEASEWNRGEELRGSGHPTPSLGALGVVDWLGGPGGHLTFSPVSVFSGEEAWRQYTTVRAMYEDAGFDYYGGFTAGQRYLNHISMIVFNRDDEEMTGRANRLFSNLIETAARNGWGEYRTHTLFYDEVARSYDYNNGALRRWNEAVKDAVDPHGIIAPGKMGIWPRAYREAGE
ncbi:FAD-binding oxidoreductase [Aurantiacibacter gilvus]|uniref:FAD-binding oxidoreductase n=1 Tax=Aurantiacibacter gilvus TaxID=3139141 RepID=A0ABU9IAJ7_9SPHN